MPERVAVIDSEAAKPEIKATLLRLDAFIVTGSTVVYVVRQRPDTPVHQARR